MSKQCSFGEIEWTSTRMPDLHSQSRGLGRNVLFQAALNAAAAAFKVSAKTAAKWVAPLSGAGDGQACRIALPGPTVLRAAPAARRSPGTSSASPALDRLPHRAHHRPEPRYRQPHPAPLSTSTACAIWNLPPPGRALRACCPRRSAPSRHQETWLVSSRLRINGNRRGQRQAGRMGYDPCRHRRSLPHRLLPDTPDQKGPFRRRFPTRCPRLLRPPRHPLPPPAHRQRPLLSLRLLPPPAAMQLHSPALLAPTPPAPTAKPNALSRPRCANGLTPALTITPKPGRALRPGSTSTTGTVPMLVWARSADQPFRSRPEQPVDTPQLDHFC